jgi:hypothetical protein
MKNKVLYWTPRILSIISILFMMMFSIDVFSENVPLSRQLLGFLIHNIPAFVLIAVLIIAWKWEITGGVIFIVITITLSILFRSFAGNPYSLLVIGPFLLIGILFIWHKVSVDRRSEKN